MIPFSWTPLWVRSYSRTEARPCGGSQIQGPHRYGGGITRSRIENHVRTSVSPGEYEWLNAWLGFHEQKLSRCRAPKEGE